MSVNPSSSFSSINFGKLFGEDAPQLKTTAKPTIATPAFVEPEHKNLNLNLTDAAAAKHGISVQTQRTRLTPAAQQDKEVQYQPGKLTGKDGKVYNKTSAPVADDERFGILVENIGKTDLRETILYKGYEATAKAAGYDDQTAARLASALVDEQKRVEESTGEQRATTFNDKTKAPTDEKRLDDVRASGELRFRVTGATLKHIEAVNQQQINQQTVMNELAQGAMPSDELLQRAGIDRAKLDVVLKEVGWQPVPTLAEAVDKLAAQKLTEALARRKEALSHGYIDTIYNRLPESQMNERELSEYTRKQAETDIRRAIGKGELQVRNEDQAPTISARTPTLADRARPLIEKYLPGIAALNTQEGIKTTNAEAFAASFINARLFGATDFYVDKSRFYNERQANEAAAFSMTGSIVGELQNLSIAGKAVEAAMNTPRIAAAITGLRESGTAGKLLAQTLPAATMFGGLETAQETVKAATGQSAGIVDATKNVVRATASGAVFGVFEPLPAAKRVVAVAAGSYGVEKVFGASDKDAAISALTNSVFSLAGGGRRAAEELNGKTIRVTGENGTAANVKVSVDAGRRIVLTEVAANAKADLQVKVGELKAAAQAKLQNGVQYLRDKVTVTPAEVSQARQTIANYKEQQAKTPLLSASLYMPPVPENPKVIRAYATLAKNTLAEGVTNFKEFSTRMIQQTSSKVQPHLGKLYEQTAADNIVKANQVELQTFKANEAKLKEDFKAIADFRQTEKLPKFAMQKNELGEKTGTVSFTEFEGEKVFGTSTKILESAGTAQVQRLAEKRELGKQALSQIQNQLGELKGQAYGVRKAEFLSHAEGESLIRAAAKYGDKLAGKEIEIRVDRLTCGRCQEGLPLLVELYGLKKATIKDAYGHVLEITKNGTTQIQ